MSRVRVYLKTYDANGDLEADFTEITKYCDLSSITKLTQSLDNTDYDIGIIRNSNINIKLHNNTGLFSSPGTAESMFLTKRMDSIVRITWDYRSYDLYAGFFNAGDEILFDETTIFEGLLNDDGSSDNAQDQMVTFTVLGYESILNRLEVPFSSIANGETISDILYDCLNQTEFTQFVTVDVSNINPSNDSIVDDVSGYENKKVIDVLRDLLLAANSVLYVTMDNILKIRSREPDVDTAFTFIGQGSNSGIENIVKIDQIRTGTNRVYNHCIWKDTTLVISDAGSIDTFGLKQKEFDIPCITDNSRRNTILQAIVDEFKGAKKELMLTCIMKPVGGIENVFLLNRVSIDYPLVEVSGLGAVYGNAVYGTDVYGSGLYNLFIDDEDSWKVMQREFNIRDETMTFRLRAL